MIGLADILTKPQAPSKFAIVLARWDLPRSDLFPCRRASDCSALDVTSSYFRGLDHLVVLTLAAEMNVSPRAKRLPLQSDGAPEWNLFRKSNLIKTGVAEHLFDLSTRKSFFQACTKPIVG